MTRVRYIGVRDPVRAFEELRPYVQQLRELQRQCKPFGADYLAIAIAIDGLTTAAYHFTKRPHFYAIEGKHQ